MKTLFCTGIILFTLSASAKGLCDLSQNDQAIYELDVSFDAGNMRGEDHAIGLKLLHCERLELIMACIKNGDLDGITEAELIEISGTEGPCQ